MDDRADRICVGLRSKQIEPDLNTPNIPYSVERNRLNLPADEEGNSLDSLGQRAKPELATHTTAPELSITGFASCRLGSKRGSLGDGEKDFVSK
jgi:hypothetical protein